MYCKKCGAMIPNGQSKCEKCGWEVPQNNQETTSSIGEQALTTPGQNSQVAEKSKLSVWCYLAIVSLCCGAFTFYKGLDNLFLLISLCISPHLYILYFVC